MANEIIQTGGAVIPGGMDNPLSLVPQTAGAMVQASEAVAKAMIAMQAAKACPRNEVKALDKAKMQCMRPSMAKIAMYSYPRGGTQVEGPSSTLINMIAACWGNLTSGYTIVERGPDYTKINAWATDLESNTTKNREETIKHYRAKGSGNNKRMELLTDERDIREYVASWAVRAERACIEKIVPRDVVEECMAQCNETMSSDIENTDPKKIQALINAFAEYKVTVPMLEQKIGRHLDAIMPAQVIMLRKIYTGLKDGYATVDQFFAVAPTKENVSESPRSEAEKIADAFGMKTGANLKTPAKKQKGSEPKGEGEEEDLDAE